MQEEVENRTLTLVWDCSFPALVLYGREISSLISRFKFSVIFSYC